MPVLASISIAYFNPRTPCGVRHVVDKFIKSLVWMSIHAPRVGCDQSRFPLWEPPDISIHAPRVGCDEMAQVSSIPPGNFNPRTPCGVRLEPPLFFGGWIGFQSTHPVWGATIAFLHSSDSFWDFNPRTPCGVRRARYPRFPQGKDFNPRTPCGVRPAGHLDGPAAIDFNPRTPCGVRQRFREVPCIREKISIHAPRVGCDPRLIALNELLNISIHAPRVGCD